jgi:Family of unknown function (DUF6717)
MNAIRVIHPYKSDGIWSFDDPAVGLLREPFVSGADEIMEQMASLIPGSEHGFTLLFSDSPFPGYEAVFEWRREEMGGNWYYSSIHDMEGWLCPALFKYFDEAPSSIYLHAKAST